MPILPPRPSFGGILAVATAAQVMREREAAAEAAAKAQRAVVSGLEAFVRTRWEAAKAAKQPHERRMLDALRARKGEYSPDKLAAIREVGGSEIFAGISAQKCRDAESWIRDIDMPADERPWKIDPAPQPDLPPDLAQQIRQGVTARMQQLAAFDPALSMANPEEYIEQVAKRVQEELREEAEERAERMGDLIETQLQAGGWEKVFRAFISDLVTFPAAILRGPTVRKRKSLTWAQDGGEWRAVVTEVLRPEPDRVSPFDLYPSPDATEMSRSYLIERMELTRSDLAAMIGVPSYSEAELRAALDEYDRGGTRTDWQGWAQSEREQIEGRGLTQNYPSETIRALSYWGSVPGKWLIEWGMDAASAPDPQAEYQVNVWLVGSHVVRAMLNDDPLGRDPYYITSFERVPGSFWGRGLPELCRPAEDGANAAARALTNNVAVASGPQVEIDTSRLPVGVPTPAIVPWQKWETENQQDRQAPAIRFFQPEMHAQELLAVYEHWSQEADHITGVPRYMHGDQQATGAATTMGGLSMLISAASKGLKDVLGNIDADVIEPMIRRMVEFNLRYSDDPMVKGDLQARAIGSSSLMLREQQAQRRAEVLNATNNPLDYGIMGKLGRAELLRATIKPLEMETDEIVPPKEELQAQMAQERAAAQQQMMMQGAQPAPQGAPA